MMRNNHGQTFRTMWLMATYSWVSLLAIVLILALFIFAQVGMIISDAEPEKAFRASLMVNIFLCAFVGVHLASAQLGLKQFHLWKNNPQFRNILMRSFLILTGGVSLILTVILAFNLDGKWLFLCTPFCATIFAAQFVLEKTMISRALVSGFPIAISQLSWLGISEAFYLIPIMIGTVIVIKRMYSPDFFRKTGYMDLAGLSQGETVKDKPKYLSGLNHRISLIVARSISRGRSVIDWAVSMPHSKFAILTTAQISLIIPFFIFAGHIGEGDPTLVETFVSLFTGTICVSVTMECRLLFFQTRAITHLYSDNNHRALKNKILFAVDKIIVTNASVMLIGSSLLSILFDLLVDLRIFLLTVSMITLVSLVFCPILLCLKWVKVSFSQVGVLLIYAGSLFGIAKLFKTYEPMLGTLPLVAIFASLLIAARLITRQFFWHKPLEKLLKVA